MAPVAYTLVTLGALLLMLWWNAYGRCPHCRHHREPRCHCNGKRTDVRRAPWRDRDPKGGGR